MSFHSTPGKFQSWHKLSWRDWSSCGVGAGLEVHQSSGIYSLTRDKISSRAHFSAGSHHSHWVSWWWTFCLSFFNKRSLFGGGQEVSWPTTPTTSPQNWKLSADFLRENNPEEGMRDERQEEDNLISGVQYIVFSSYGDYFLSVLGEVCKSLATWDNNNIDNTEEEWMLWAHNNDRVIISMLALHNLSSVGANISNRNCSVT